MGVKTDLKSVGAIQHPKLTELLLKRGIPSHLHYHVSEYNVLITHYGRNVSRNYFFLGLPTYSKKDSRADGAILSSWYKKMGSMQIGVKAHCILNPYGAKTIITSSIWDYLSYLAMIGNPDVMEKVRAGTRFIISPKGFTKNDLKEIPFLDYQKKIVLMLKNNSSGNTYSNNAMKVFKDKDITDARPKYERYLSYNESTFNGKKSEN